MVQDERKIIYTTNAIKWLKASHSLHMQLRKIVKNRGQFPSDEAATKLLYLALRNITKDWMMPPRIWKEAANQFGILFVERFTDSLNEKRDLSIDLHTKFWIRPSIRQLGIPYACDVEAVRLPLS